MSSTTSSIPSFPSKLNVQAGPATQLKLPTLTPRKQQPAPANPVPAPVTAELPTPPDIHFLRPVEPSRRILSAQDLELFLKSPTYTLITSFVFSVSESCADKTISLLSSQKSSRTIQVVGDILDLIESLIAQHPPEDQGASRFGNPAFRGFLDSLDLQLEDYHERLVLPDKSWVQEVAAYLKHSFGSRSRIDYGSGHELNFAMWLLCLNRLSLIKAADFPAIGLVIFPQYIKFLRKIQSTYYLEPAGSHGVWGLDDYHFLPFLIGASQLIHHPYIRPRAIHNEIVIEEESKDYIYLDMVRWTVETKTVKGLKWTQPMLDDISSARNWGKVEQGMRRMFVKEVLGKLPIMQHFLFGTLVPAAPDMGHEDASLEQGHEDLTHTAEGIPIPPKHVHTEDTWGDHCGIKLPSTVAASEEARKNGANERLRRIPFD